MMRKYSAKEIEERLLQLGTAPNEIEVVIKDVSEIVESRIIKTIAERTPEGVKALLSDKTPEEVSAYFAEYPEHIAMISRDEIFEIEDQTWSDYFESVTQ
jgi:hypothetical protein